MLPPLPSAGYLFICFFVNRSPFRTHSRTHSFVDGLCWSSQSRGWVGLSGEIESGWHCCPAKNCFVVVHYRWIYIQSHPTIGKRIHHELSTRSEFFFFSLHKTILCSRRVLQILIEFIVLCHDAFCRTRPSNWIAPDMFAIYAGIVGVAIKGVVWSTSS